MEPFGEVNRCFFSDIIYEISNLTRAKEGVLGTIKYITIKEKSLWDLGTGIVTITVSLPIMNYYFELSNYPVSFFESQLSFSGEIIKFHYSNMKHEELTFYLYGNLVDYGFMIGNGLVKFGVAIIVARGFREGTRVIQIGLTMFLVGILGTVFDALENIFIILMTFDPSTFPNIFAIIHSIFALFKYITTVVFYGWILGAIFFLLLQWLRSSPKYNGFEAK